MHPRSLHTTLLVALVLSLTGLSFVVSGHRTAEALIPQCPEPCHPAPQAIAPNPAESDRGF